MPQNAGRILLVSATEIEKLKEEIPLVDTLVTGVGMVATSTALTKKLIESKFDIVVNIGISGSFNAEFPIGSVVQVISDRLVEMGVEDNGKFTPADEMSLCNSSEVHFETSQRVLDLPTANGITVNRVHGTLETIQKIVNQFNPDVESMEGAAVAYVCQQFGVPWVQTRAISNKVEPRNRAAWNTELALHNLNTEVLKYLKSLQLEE